MNHFVETIATTPWWVYVIFVFLIRIGLSARKSRIVPFKNLFIIPCLFLLLSIASFYSYLFNVGSGTIWMSSVLIGIALGWLQFSWQQVKAIKNEDKLLIPGTWSLLIILVTIFIAKYFFNFQLTADPAFLANKKHLFIVMGVYGLSVGLFFGRAMYALRCLRQGPFVT